MFTGISAAHLLFPLTLGEVGGRERNGFARWVVGALREGQRAALGTHHGDRFIHGDSNLAWAVCLAWPTARWESHSSHKDSGATSFASDAAHLGGFTVLTIRQTVSKLALLCPQAVFIQHRDETFSAFLHRA